MHTGSNFLHVTNYWWKFRTWLLSANCEASASGHKIIEQDARWSVLQPMSLTSSPSGICKSAHPHQRTIKSTTELMPPSSASRAPCGYEPERYIPMKIFWDSMLNTWSSNVLQSRMTHFLWGDPKFNCRIGGHTAQHYFWRKEKKKKTLYGVEGFF